MIERMFQEMPYNPEIDYPCHRTFWETDEQYELRSERMKTLRKGLSIKEDNQYRLKSLIDTEERTLSTLQWYNDNIAGSVSDIQAKKGYEWAMFLEKKIQEHKRLRDQYFEQIGAMRKQLSELTR